MLYYVKAHFVCPIILFYCTSNAIIVSFASLKITGWLCNQIEEVKQKCDSSVGISWNKSKYDRVFCF